MKKIIQHRVFWKGIAILLTTPCLLCVLYAFMVYINMEIQNSIPMVATLCFVFLGEMLVIRNEFDGRNFTNKKNNQGMKVNSLGQTKGRNMVNIALNLIVLFLLISLIILKTNSESYQIPLVVEMMIWILCVVSITLWLLVKYRKGRNWKTVFNTKNDVTCNTTSQLLKIILFFVLLVFFIKNFTSFYVWIPGIVLGICAAWSLHNDPKNQKETNVKFFVISAIFCLVCAMISTIVQFWSSEVFGVTLWQLLACVMAVIMVLFFWAFSELLKSI